jgi:hypothetical protein
VRKRAINIEWRNLGHEIQPLRQHHLKDVAGGNVFLGLLHRADKIGPAGSRMNLQFPFGAARSRLPLRWTQSSSQLFLQHFNVSHRAVIRLSRTLPRNVGAGDDVDLVPQMVEGQQPVEKHQRAIGKLQIILGARSNIF